MDIPRLRAAPEEMAESPTNRVAEAGPHTYRAVEPIRGAAGTCRFFVGSAYERAGNAGIAADSCCTWPAATLFALAGCGGLGVNFGSGPKGSSGVNHVTIFVTSGVNIPTVNHGFPLALTCVAYDVRGYISTTQGCVWSTEGLRGGILLFLDAQCATPCRSLSQTTLPTPALSSARRRARRRTSASWASQRDRRRSTPRFPASPAPSTVTVN